MRAFISSFLLLALVACGGGSSVAGSYSLDTKAFVEAAKQKMGAMFEQMPAEQKQMFDSMMAKMKVDMTLAADGTYDIKSETPEGKSEMKGTYKVEGQSITMTGKEVGKDKEETKVGKIDGSTITVVMENEGESMTMVFKKN